MNSVRERPCRRLPLGCLTVAPIPAAAQAPHPVVRHVTTRSASRPATHPATAPATQPVKTDTLEACQAALMKGQYDAAAKGFDKLRSNQSMRVSAAIGMARALAWQGQYPKAIETLDAAAKDATERIDWHVLAAEILSETGQYDKALDRARSALALDVRHAPAILLHGLLLETLGKKKEALAAYQTMDAVVSTDAYRKDAPTLVALGNILDRYAILAGRRASEQAGNILHNYFQDAYQKVDEKYWPANIAAGMLLLNKHRGAEAAQEFQLALKANPNAADAFVGLGAIVLGQWQFEACMAQVAKALKVNPAHTQALLLKATCLMQWRKFDQVMGALDELLKVNPNHLEALSLAAAFHVRMRHEDKAKPFIERVKKVNAGYAGLPETIGDWLSAGHQYKEAEGYFQEAMKLAPELAGPVADLAKLYLQTGQEDKAREFLDKAHSLDDFRADIVNYIKLLKEMETFQVLETEHFIIKVANNEDRVLLDQVGEYAEKMHKEVCADFNHVPPVKTMVEIFPTHPQFSVRITGRGWIGTIGAATGTVIVLVAPNKERSQFGTFNWATVLRHEYTHTVTLSATNNNIPRWFTEACAVWQQPDRRDYNAVRKLVTATRMGQLYPIKELDWGFIRPSRGGGQQLAYAQAEWMMEYIIQAKGYKAILRMLEGFRDGHNQEKVLYDALAMSEAELDKRFREWANGQILEWGYDNEKVLTPPEAEKLIKDKPKEAASHAARAVAMYFARNTSEAEKSARKALDLDERNVQALSVLANLYLAKRQYDDALKYARNIEQIDPTSRTAPRVMAECHLARRNWVAAIAALERLKVRRPLDPFSYERLASLYTQMGQIEKALPNLMELHRRSMKDPQYARRIGDLYRSLDKDDLALEYYQQVAFINPYDSSVYEAIASIHRNARRYKPALQAIQKVCVLEEKSADAWAKMAMMQYLAAKDAKDDALLAKARESAQKSVELDPKGQGKQILQHIQQTPASGAGRS